jgi:hypothetical protein
LPFTVRSARGALARAENARRAIGIRNASFAAENQHGFVQAVVPVELAGSAIPELRRSVPVRRSYQVAAPRLRIARHDPFGVDRRRFVVDLAASSDEGAYRHALLAAASRIEGRTG